MDKTTPSSDPSGEFRAYLVRSLVARGEQILATIRPSGRMGTDPWIVRDQDGILTLALLRQTPGHPRHRDPELLTSVAAAGRYLRSRQDSRGMYPFVKKDGSDWGTIYMPWTYLRWMLSYSLLCDDLSASDRAVWEEGLLLGYGGIAATELSSRSNIYPGPIPGQPPLRDGEVRPWLHNIPAHHAAGLYLAGREFGRHEWMHQATEFMAMIARAQSEHGWWTEHVGPVVLYNRVYLEALAVYHRSSGDSTVLASLERGNRFHWNCTYPNGAMIETVDERNPYGPLRVVNRDGPPSYYPERVVPYPALFASREGRALLGHQWDLLKHHDPEELENADLLQFCLPPGPEPLVEELDHPARFSMDDKALVARETPWIVSLSAYCAPRTPNRFIQDRQNLISVYHEEVGLIVGGGNTKLQPYWSTMTVGDPGLVSPAGATRATDLAPEIDVLYVPDRVTIGETSGRSWRMTVETGAAALAIDIRILSAMELEIGCALLRAHADGSPVRCNLTLIPYPGQPVHLPGDRELPLETESFALDGLPWIRHHRWLARLPERATVRWPVLPHNPYRDDGAAEAMEGRLVVSVPVEAGTPASLRLTCSAPGSTLHPSNS